MKLIRIREGEIEVNARSPEDAMRTAEVLYMNNLLPNIKWTDEYNFNFDEIEEGEEET